MAIVTSKILPDIDYPSSDGQPMGETPLHRRVMYDNIETLDVWFQDDPLVYVSGNMFVFWVEGDRHKHISPDVFLVRGISKTRLRDYYLVWEEKRPDYMLEVTSRSTREEDIGYKFLLYQDVLRVPEFFLFDPRAEYLKPALQGYRLQRGKFVPIKKVKNRLPSEVLGLHLERVGTELRLFDPSTQQRLLTPREAWINAEAENARLRQEMEGLRRRLNGQS